MAAGGDLEAVVVPVGHDGELQIQVGDLQIADVAVAVDVSNRHFRIQGLGGGGSLPGLGFGGGACENRGDGLGFQDGLELCHQVLGFLTGVGILPEVVTQKKQC